MRYDRSATAFLRRLVLATICAACLLLVLGGTIAYGWHLEYLFVALVGIGCGIALVIDGTRSG